MAFTAREVIDAARAWHPSFDEVSNPTTVAFDWLNTFVRVERRKLLSLAPETLLEQTTLALPFAVFSEGSPIAGAEQIFTASALTAQGDTTRGDPVTMQPLEHLTDIGAWPAAAWVGGGVNRLYLKGAADDWNDYQAILVNYIAAPTALVALDDDVGLPDAYLDTCIMGLCVFFGMRMGKERIGPQQINYFLRLENEARMSADAAVSAQRAGEVWRIRELA